ncbi:MAG: hypothetical protein WHU94_16315 [Thermogemmata sp.]|jgi:hypothetical protein|uniref:Uncharacterized protein n=1 Tax=Thermogemmata fonticola TaxID=2755323 RepID=A0A7V9ADN7_9BACT|nr:hypothetical protein [Thermogemmata fonticola]MBA2227962.1 hypothetical protein [Thermogemmata fonticola]MCX8141145.1 hypothetical protein [Gemmataceae bacterium]
MQQISQIPFLDAESKGEGIVIITARKGCVGICISSRENGDLEVFLPPEKGEQLIAAITEALMVAKTIDDVE